MQVITLGEETTQNQTFCGQTPLGVPGADWKIFGREICTGAGSRV
jgi:hypothetical protein